MATDNVALMKRFVEEVWNKGNLSVADELATKTSIFHEPVAKELTSVDAFKQHVQSLRTAFPDLNVKIEDIGSFGDEVVIRWTATGTNKGPFLGAGATNKPTVLPGISLNRLQGGKLVEAWISYDVLGLVTQLGLAPAPERTTQASVH